MSNTFTTRLSTVFLQGVIVLIGIGVLVFLLWEPQLEGRNLNATLFEIYFTDFFLAYVYLASLSFFVALYQAFRVLGYIRFQILFSKDSVSAVRTIKYCALSLAFFFALPVAYLFIVRPGDDIAGGVAMGLVIILLSIVFAAVAAVLEGLIHSVIDEK